MYSQFELDHMDEQTYREFLFWDGQISKEALDNPPNYAIMDNMKDIEIEGDLRDEYLAHQEAEASQEEISGLEVSQLLIEMWEEEREREKMLAEDLEYTEEDAYRDFHSDQYEEWN